jgi:hypothetical protein
MQLIAQRKNEIAVLKQERDTLLAAKALDPAKLALFNEHHPTRWVKKALKER